MTALVLHHIPRGRRARGPSDAFLIAEIAIANVINAAFWIWVFA